MPYIKKEDRKKFINDETGIDYMSVIADNIDNPGDFNYVITCLMQDYLVKNGLNYQHLNNLLGAIEGAKLEMYRRIAASYEDKKIDQNGDVLHPVLEMQLNKGKKNGKAKD